ncbi:MAG: MFS transporter [Gammaproteobacteria bacterium]|nr:MFS transporter [Gammaproteobacteria bacterium]
MTAAAGGWRARLGAYADPKMQAMLALGFSSGLPFLLVFSTLSAWLTQAGVKRATIGFFSWCGLAFSFKYLWSPLVDRLPLPLLGRLGRRRSWMLLAQAAVVLALIQMALADPAQDVVHVAVLAILLAFAAATQDIALDAWRIESTPADRAGPLTGAFQIGYRIALIAAGAGALFAAAEFGWRSAYLLMAALMVIGLITTCLITEPTADPRRGFAHEARVTAFLHERSGWPRWLRESGAWFIGAVVCPFLDLFRRLHPGHGVLVLAFIVVYRLSDFTMGVMANNFYLSLGFTLKEIASISKIFGVLVTMAGVAVAGGLIARWGVGRTLTIGVVTVSLANLYFSWIASHPPDLAGLAVAIAFDNIGVGIAGTAFVVYLSALPSPAYTATQYALLGMFWSAPCKWLAGYSGAIIEAIGFPLFFCYTAALGLPAIVLSMILSRKPALRETPAAG